VVAAEAALATWHLALLTLECLVGVRVDQHLHWHLPWQVQLIQLGHETESLEPILILPPQE